MPSLVGGYLAAVTLFMVFVLHLSVSPERFLLLMLIAALILGRAKLFLADWIPFLVLFLSYEYLRGLSGKLGMPIHDVTSLERVVSFFPLGLGYLFWVVDRRTFLRFSRALIAMSFAAFVFYLLLPVAPPWKALPTVVKIIDHTLPSFTDIPGIPVPATVYHWLTPNQYAAMPSLHAAYPLLGALFALRLWGRRAWPALIYTACVWLSIVYLGEHYVVDVIGAVIFALAAFFGEDWFTQFWQRRRSQREEAELATSARSSS